MLGHFGLREAGIAPTALLLRMPLSTAEHLISENEQDLPTPSVSEHQAEEQSKKSMEVNFVF